MPEDRKYFDNYLKKILNKQVAEVNKDPRIKKIPFPEKGTLYNYNLDLKADKTDIEWTPWTELIKIEDIPA